MGDIPLTGDEIEKAQVGEEIIYLKLARDKLKGDVYKLADERLRIEREVKSYLPKKFIEAYLELINRSLGVGKDYRLDPNSPGMLGTKDGGRDFKSGDGGLRDNGAAEYRRNIDRQLRVISRKMNDWLAASVRDRLTLNAPVRCGKCSKFCDYEWRHCAWCGMTLRDAQSGKEE